MVWLPMVKNLEVMFIYFGRLHKRDRHDGICIALHVKKEH